MSGLVNDQIDGIVCACANSVYQALFSRHTPLRLGTRLGYITSDCYHFKHMKNNNTILHH